MKLSDRCTCPCGHLLEPLVRMYTASGPSHLPMATPGPRIASKSLSNTDTFAGGPRCSSAGLRAECVDGEDVRVNHAAGNNGR